MRWVHQPTNPAPCLVSTQRALCVCARPLAGSIFVYWTTFCQLPIAHQLLVLVLSATQIVQTQLVARTDRGRKKKRVQVQKVAAGLLLLLGQEVRAGICVVGGELSTMSQ